MAKLKLGSLVDEKPVRLTVELPAQVHRDLLAYAEALGREMASAAPVEAAKLVGPMLARSWRRIGSSRSDVGPGRACCGSGRRLPNQSLQMRARQAQEAPEDRIVVPVRPHRAERQHFADFAPKGAAPHSRPILAQRYVAFALQWSEHHARVAHARLSRSHKADAAAKADKGD